MDKNRVTMDKARAMKLASRFFNVVLVLTLVFACLLAVIAALSDRDRSVWGLRTYVVSSGSMEPHIHTGSVIIVRDADASAVQVGDVITYTNGEEYVAHRVIDRLPDGSLVTKGDANDVADAPVTPGAVSGRVVFTIPFLGSLSAFVHSLAGFLLLIVFPACLLLGMYLKDIWMDGTKIKPAGLSILLLGLMLCACFVPAGIQAYYADRSDDVGIYISGPARPEVQLPTWQDPLEVEESSDQQQSAEQKAEGLDTDTELTEPEGGDPALEDDGQPPPDLTVDGASSGPADTAESEGGATEDSGETEAGPGEVGE